MKKFAIGCAVALAVVVVLVGILGYLAYDRFFKPMAQFGTSVQQVVELDKQVKNTAHFSVPSNDELTQEMVSRFVQVQERVQAALGPRMAQLQASYEKLDRTLKAEDREASPTEVMGALGALSTVLVEAKKAQVDALNAAGFSVDEYRWVRDQAYAALGVVASGLDLARLSEGDPGVLADPDALKDRTFKGAVPDRNRELVAPFEQKLKEWAAFAFFGL